MARKDRKVRLVRRPMPTVDLMRVPVALGFSVQPGEATLLNLTSGAGGRLKLVVCEGEVLDFPPLPDQPSPHFKFAPQAPLADFLNRYSLAGGSHHLGMGYGQHASTLEKIAQILGVEYVRV